MAATVSITAATQLEGADGSGVLKDIKVTYTFVNPDGAYDVSLEYKSSSGNWASCWDVVGTIGVDVVSTSIPLIAYWHSPEQMGNLEQAVGLRIVATK